MNRVLSIRQPWAWLIVNGYKTIENRTWSTKVRGPILIHASKAMSMLDWFACADFIRGIKGGWDGGAELVNKLPFELLDRGGIVGSATILDCVDHHESEWFTGPFGFVLADAKPLSFIPLKGRLGFFSWDGVIAEYKARGVDIKSCGLKEERLS